MKILLINTQPIPPTGHGAASVNRIYSYTKGLIKAGHDVCILSTGYGKNEWHEYEGVLVKHLAKNNSRNIINLLLLACRLIRLIPRVEKDCILLVTDNYFLTVLLGVYCRVKRIKIVLEVNEYPFILMSQSKLKKILAPLFINTAYKFLDGIIVISKPLMDFYSKKAGKNCKLIEIPMTVDATRFDNIENNTVSKYGNYIAYCGNMGGNKDGLANLIEAFSIVEKRGYPLKLLLIGGATNQEDYEKLQVLNVKLGNKNVIFYGKANRDEMPLLLKEAKILALARPSSLQASGGFPTKLGEYLATGNPVVITAVGDIPRYLHNGDNAFVVEPDDNSSFADALCYVWDHYEQAREIGKKGKLLTTTVFNGNYQATRIAKFLTSII